MAMRSMGLQFAIHFRVRQNGSGHRSAKFALRKAVRIISGFGDLGPALTNLAIVRLLRFGGRQRNPISDRIRGRRASACQAAVRFQYASNDLANYEPSRGAEPPQYLAPNGLRGT
jgi:hypothetical protein